MLDNSYLLKVKNFNVSMFMTMIVRFLMICSKCVPAFPLQSLQLGSPFEAFLIAYSLDLFKVLARLLVTTFVTKVEPDLVVNE